MNYEEYNKMVSEWPGSQSSLNRVVMEHTLSMCKTNVDLAEKIAHTKDLQFILNQEDWGKVELPTADGPTTNIVISRKRTMEAAKVYPRTKKVAVLNFANNHVVGGAPFWSNAQEESLCRTSTLYECLLKEEKTFYMKHQKMFDEGKLDYWGNGDLIYSPDVVVFKTDDNAPKVLPEEEWYMVDVITVAAPQLYRGFDPHDYSCFVQAAARLEKVFKIAKQQGVEVLILGAWGCGAFHNPPEQIAQAFKTLCSLYHFDTIEFAICCRDWETENYQAFKKVLESK